MQELGNSSHLCQAEAVPVALQALAGGHAADVVLELEVGGEGRSLLRGAVAVHRYEEGTAVGWISGDVHVLKGRAWPLRRRERLKEVTVFMQGVTSGAPGGTL